MIKDISRTISEKTAVWPGDTPFSRKYVMAIEEGQAVNTSTITLSTHTGSHADAPLHFEAGAPGIGEVSLDAYIGRCRVLTARDPVCARVEDVEGLDLRAEERLLFRSQKPLADDEWDDDFAYLHPDLARKAAREGLRLIGLDTPSVDPMTSKTMEAHKALLSGGVSILESLDLRSVPDGLYELIALPLKIRGGDSAPVRAVLRPWEKG